MEALPKARRSDLVVTQLDNELLVYDTVSNQAFCLNETAAAIWDRCDGSSTLDDIASEVGLDRQLVALSISDLGHRDLLAGPIDIPRPNGVTRRRILSAAAVAALTIPVILSVVAPAAAQAASCVATGLTVNITNSPAAGGSAQCQATATNRCCSLSSFNFGFTVNGDGTINCHVTCGNLNTGPAR